MKPLAIILVFLPFLLAAVTFLLRRKERAFQWITLFGSGFVFLFSVFSCFLGADALEIIFIPTATILFFLGMLYETSPARKLKGIKSVPFLFLLEGILMGLFLTHHFLLFEILYLLEIFPVAFLLSNVSLARNYIYAMLASSFFVFIGLGTICLGYWQKTGSFSFSASELLTTNLSEEWQKLSFVFLMIAFLLKIPAFPFHFWLPQVMKRGPMIGVGVFLLGIKLGAYGILRLVIPFCPIAIQEWGWVVLVLSSIGIIYASFISFVQTDLRGLIAYSSIAHMSLIVASIFMMNFHGIEGGLLLLLSSGVGIAGLCFLSGFIEDRPREDGHFPQIALAFLVVSLSIVGMPGTSGFNGEHLVMLGALQKHWALTIIAGLSTLLSAAYFIRYYQRVFCEEDKITAGSHQLNRRESIILLIVCAIIFGTGLFSSPVLKVIEPMVHKLVEPTVHKITKPGSSP